MVITGMLSKDLLSFNWKDAPASVRRRADQAFYGYGDNSDQALRERNDFELVKKKLTFINFRLIKSLRRINLIRRRLVFHIPLYSVLLLCTCGLRSPSHESLKSVVK